MSSESVQYKNNGQLKPALNGPRLASIVQLIEGAQEEALFPGAVICIKQGEEVLLKQAFGQFFPDEHSEDNYPMNTDTAFDWATLQLQLPLSLYCFV